MNAAKCARCGDVIVSRFVHDFVACKCGAIFVDGGREYNRGGFDTPKSFIPLYTAEQREAAGVTLDEPTRTMSADAYNSTFN